MKLPKSPGYDDINDDDVVDDSDWRTITKSEYPDRKFISEFNYKTRYAMHCMHVSLCAVLSIQMCTQSHLIHIHCAVT